MLKQARLCQFLFEHTEAHIRSYGAAEPYLYVESNAGRGNYHFSEGLSSGNGIRLKLDRDNFYTKVVQNLVYVGRTEFDEHNPRLSTGDVEGDILGSPIIGLEMFRRNMLNYRSVFTEADYDNYLELWSRLNDKGLLTHEDCKLFCADNKSLVDLLQHIVKIPLDSKGLFYCDPHGEIPFECLFDMSMHYENMDILVQFGATTMKRLHARFGNNKLALGQFFLSYKEKIVDREHMFISDARTAQKMMFAYFTDDPNRSEHLKNIGWLKDINSSEGAKIASELI